MVFSRSDVGVDGELEILGKEIPNCQNYKYLGVTFSDSVNYLDCQETIRREK